MNAQTETPAETAPYDVSGFDFALYHGFKPAPGTTRHEGWTPEKQRTFLEALSEGRTVIQACEIVGLSKQSAYALRGSARGASFALGWDAAVIKARDALADELMERAMRGQREKIDDGSRLITRHRFDNRLAFSMLGRLDRMADSQKVPAAAAAARLVACDFAQYLDLVERDAGPARAGVFLGARLPAGAEPAGEDDLAPLRTLARADKWLRTHTDIAEPLAIADLDPADRDRWTAEQWRRAEAAGLVSLAPEPKKEADSSQASQPASQATGQPEPGDPVWWDDIADAWRTRFPPPEDFWGVEEGAYGEEGYERELCPDEKAALDAITEKETALLRARETQERALWLAAMAAEADAIAVPADAEPIAPGSPAPVEAQEPDEAPVEEDDPIEDTGLFEALSALLDERDGGGSADAPLAEAAEIPARNPRCSTL